MDFTIKNQTFPSESLTCKNYTFENCIFKKGDVHVSELCLYCYQSCHFKAESRHFFTEKSFGILFNDCTFEAGSHLFFTGTSFEMQFKQCTFDSGAMVDFGNDTRKVSFYGCFFPIGDPIFSGRVQHQLDFARMNPNEPLPTILPPCGCLRIRDGEGYANWDTLTLCNIPPRTDVTYFNQSLVSSSHVLDDLVSLLLRYPMFSVGLLRWGGNNDDYTKFYKVLHHPHRCQIVTILIFLGGQSVLPRDLVRSELCKYLI